MRTLVLLSLLSVFALTALAQDAPRVEVFGGYSYLRSNVGGIPDDTYDLHGWNAAANVSVNKWFGVKADFSGHYRGDQVPVFSSTGSAGTINVRTSQHTFLFGPQFSARNDNFTTFGHALAGFSRQGNNLASGLSIGGVNQPQTGFAMAFGGGVDGKITDNVWVRAIQLDYLYTRLNFPNVLNQPNLNGVNVHSLRLSTGLVIRAGKQ